MPQDLSSTPPNMEELFGAPPIITGELESAYKGLLDRAREILEPNDLIDEIYVRDVVDLEWNVIRYRRIKADLIQGSRHVGLERVLTPIMDAAAYAQDLSWHWAKRDKEAVAEVDRLLASASLTMAPVMAETFAARIQDLERIEHLLASAEARRTDALRELARHKKEAAAALKTAMEKVEDAEFEDVDPSDARAKPRT